MLYYIMRIESRLHCGKESSSFSCLDVRKDSRQLVKDGCQYKRGDRWAEKENSPTWYVRNSNHLFTAGLSGVLKHLLSHKPHFAIPHFPQSHVGLCVNLDGDKKAYSESSQWAIKGNKEVISKLRQENKQLRAKLSKRMKVSVHIVQKISKHNIAYIGHDVNTYPTYFAFWQTIVQHNLYHQLLAMYQFHIAWWLFPKLLQHMDGGRGCALLSIRCT